MILDKSKKYSILTNNITEFIDIQQYFFNKNILWISDNKPDIYPKIHKRKKLKFPRYINIFYEHYIIEKQAKFILINNNEEIGEIIPASQILRKFKLLQLKTNTIKDDLQ